MDRGLEPPEAHGRFAPCLEELVRHCVTGRVACFGRPMERRVGRRLGRRVGRRMETFCERGGADATVDAMGLSV